MSSRISKHSPSSAKTPQQKRPSQGEASPRAQRGSRKAESVSVRSREHAANEGRKLGAAAGAASGVRSRRRVEQISGPSSSRRSAGLGSGSSLRGGSASGPGVPSGEGASYSRDESAARLKEKRRTDAKAKDRKRIWIGSGVFVAIIIVVTLVMSWNLWWRYDDAADIQGTWTVQGSKEKVKITDSAIYLTDTLFYNYSLDTNEKRITFSFEDKQGDGVYSFSNNRNTLTIAEENADLATNEEDPSIFTTLERESSDE